MTWWQYLLLHQVWNHGLCCDGRTQDLSCIAITPPRYNVFLISVIVISTFTHVDYTCLCESYALTPVCLYIRLLSVNVFTSYFKKLWTIVTETLGKVVPCGRKTIAYIVRLIWLTKKVEWTTIVPFLEAPLRIGFSLCKCHSNSSFIYFTYQSINKTNTTFPAFCGVKYIVLINCLSVVTWRDVWTVWWRASVWEGPCCQCWLVKATYLGNMSAAVNQLQPF